MMGKWGWLLVAAFAVGCAEEEQPVVERAALEFDTLIAGTIPDGYDLEGTWTIDPGGIISERALDGTACEEVSSRFNKLMHGRDTLVLDKGEATIEDGVVVVPYTGTYSHWDGFGRTESGDPFDTVVYGCVAQNVLYDVEAELRIDIDTLESEFGGTGVATNAPTYQYPRVVGFVPASEGDPVLGTGRLYRENDNDVAIMHVTFGDYTGDTAVPAGCDFALGDIQGGILISNGCAVTGFRPWDFQRVSGLPDIQPRGEITGNIETMTPDGVDRDGPAETGRVSLFQQTRLVRDKQPNETDEAYSDYVEAERRKMQEVDRFELKAENSGMFKFDRVAGFARDPAGTATYREALYTIEVTKARKPEIDPMAPNDFVFYEVRQVHNVRVGQMRELQVRPFAALGRKIDIAGKLRTRAPNGWGPTEAGILTVLEELADGTRPMTPEANEAVSRAFWAELAARDAFNFAEQLIGFMLDGFADTITEFVPSVDFNLRNIAKGQQRIRNYSPEAAQAQSSFDILRSGKIEEAHRAMEASKIGLKSSSHNSAQADKIKNAAKVLIFNPIKTRSSTFGLPAATVATIVDAIATTFNAIVDMRLTGNFGGYVKDAIKNRIKSFVKARKDLLLDGGSPFPSFTRLSDEGLRLTAMNIETWGVNDRDAYRVDRNAAIAEITAMNKNASEAVAKAQVVKGAASGLAMSEDTFKALAVIPGFSTAETASKWLKRLANFTLFVDPALTVFFQMPGQVERAGYHAWGAPIPGASPVVYSTTVGPNPALGDDLQATVTEFVERLDRYTLLSGAFGEADMVDLYYGLGEEPSSDELFAQLRLQRERVMDELAARDAELEFWFPALEVQQAIRAEAKLEDLRRVMADFLIDVSTGAFKDIRDEWYLMRRYDLRERIAETKEAIDSDLYRLGWLAGDDVAFAPLVRAENVRVVDSAGSEFLDPSSARTLTVTADVTNLSVVSVADVSARLVVTTDSGQATVTGNAEQLVTGSLAAYGGSNVATASWTVQYTPGDADDRVVVRVEPFDGATEGTAFVGSSSSVAFGPDPATIDADLDGLPDAWEGRFGLQLDADDFEDDPDGDGVPNFVEHSIGLDPTTADTDGDGRTDGDELYGGTLQVVSDPLVADTDGDGTNDGADAAPLDEGSTTADTTFEEPCVVVEPAEIVLTMDEPAVVLDVSNGCAGNLQWSARIADGRIARLLLRPDEQSPGSLVVASALPLTLDPFTDNPVQQTTTLYVADIGGRAPDVAEVVVHLGSAPDGTTGGDMGMDADMGDGPNNGTTNFPDTGFPGGPPAGGGEDGGCCSTVPARRGPALALALMMLVGLVRRRQSSVALSNRTT